MKTTTIESITINPKDELVQAILQSRTFKTNQHQLANALHINDQEAKAELLDKVMNGRFRGLDAKEEAYKVRHNDPVSLWKITYAKRDLQAHYFHQLNKQAGVTNQLKSLATESYSMEPDEDELDLEAIKEMLPDLFPIAKTRDFIMLVLTVGKEETMARLNMTSRAFGQKVKGIQHYATDHRLKFNKVAKQQEDQEATNEIELLKAITDLVESEGFEDDQLTELLKEPEFLAEANELVDCPEIKSQYAIVYQFHLAYQEDKYTFVNNVYARLVELEKEVNND